MAAMDFFVLNAAQVATAQSLDDDVNAAIAPRPIDGASPGIGTNSNGIAAGAPVTLAGTSVAPARIAEDPNYLFYCPNLAPFLLTLPVCTLETDTIFAPVVE